MKLLLLGVLTLGGCTILTGLSIEGNAGVTYYDYATGAVARTGVGYQAGLTASIEYDYNRSSTMGLGIGPQLKLLPTSGDGELVSGFAEEYWLGAALEGRGSATMRPRAHIGVQSLRARHAFFTGYFGLGASFHARQGRMWHVLAGPDYTIASSGDDEYRGLGAFVRVRYLRMFFARCDRYVAPDESDGYVSVDDLCRERP